MAGVIQPWLCEKCNRASAFEYAEGAGVYEVRNQLEDEHARLEPECAADWGIAYVRVIFGEAQPAKAPIADDPAPPFSTAKMIEHNDGRHVTRDTSCPVCWTTAHINELSEA